MSVRIILVDDHQMFRQALRIMLEKAADLEIVAEAGSVAELLPCIRQSNPDVICMDIGMPGINGIAATREVLAIDPRIKVIGLSSFTDKEYVLGLLDAGAVGYVAKAEATDELLRAIRTVQLGRVYLSPGISASLAGLVRDGVVQDVGASRLGPGNYRCCAWSAKATRRRKSPRACAWPRRRSTSIAATSCASSICTASPS